MSPDLVVVKYGEVRLPRSMMGRLTAEDWRPLLAPSILYNYVLARDKNRGSFMRLVLPVGLGEIPLVFALLQILGPANRGSWGPLLFATVTLWTVYALSLLALYIRWLWRSLSYTADQRAANTIGKEVLLDGLARYRDTITTTGFTPKRLHFWLTLNQRIERLRNDSR